MRIILRIRNYLNKRRIAKFERLTGIKTEGKTTNEVLEELAILWDEYNAEKKNKISWTFIDKIWTKCYFGNDFKGD